MVENGRVSPRASYSVDSGTPIVTPASSFAVELTVNVAQHHNNQWRNVFHMGRHVLILDRYTLVRGHIIGHL